MSRVRRIGGVNIYEMVHAWINLTTVMNIWLGHGSHKCQSTALVYSVCWYMNYSRSFTLLSLDPHCHQTPPVCSLQRSCGLSHMWYRDEICSSAMRKCTTLKLRETELAQLIWILLAEPIFLSVKDWRRGHLPKSWNHFNGKRCFFPQELAVVPD